MITLHLWAVLGYAIGIDDKFNIALQPDLQTARRVYKEMFETFNIPNLFNMDEHTVALMEITLKVGQFGSLYLINLTL